MRIRPAAPRPWPMLRTALAVVAPLLAGLAMGRIALGLLPAMGAMGTALADQGGSYRARVVRMGATALGGAAGFLVGAAARETGWWAVLVTVAVAVLSALVSTTGAAGSSAGLQLLVMTVLGTGVPLGPPGAGTLLFLLGSAWALALALADWPLHPRAPEEAAVIAAYRALGALAAGRDAGTVVAFDTALRNAYDTVFGARSASAGTDPWRTRAVALLNQASLVRNALISLDLEGRDPPEGTKAAVEGVADALAGGPLPARTPGEGPDSPATRALGSALEGAVELLYGGDPPADGPPYEWRDRGERLRQAWERMWSGRLTRVYTVRLALCVGVASALSELHLVERSYWTTLTVALVLKPDFGSVFARAVQRALGTLAGTVIGTVVLVAVPYGPALLVPVAVFAALLPYGMQRNWGLMSAFQAPLVLLLVDLLTRGGPRLAEIRLVDTLAGCLIVLLLGYLPWPASWEAPVGPRFADAVSATADYLRHAFDPGHTGRAALRHRVYDALADLRTVFQRAMTEPAVVSRRVTTWMPAMTALERVADATAATVARTEHGAPRPSAGAVGAAVASLEGIARDVRAGTPPGRPELAREDALERVNAAVRGLGDTVSGHHTC
ncbi:FUSC family protein [Streptosporangium sp. NPDC020072]|uniref:FUSC family protein n=1 Tax=Streptosporangium jomthongense TaxID=1193683 RepID=A0ABV8EXF5_9ACTN